MSMNKIDYNKIELQPFGKKSLRIILSVLEDIKVKIELGQTNQGLTLRYAKKVDDITESERRHAIDFLIANNVIAKHKSELSLSSFFKNQIDNELAMAIDVYETPFKEMYQGINDIVSPEDKDKINKQDVYFDFEKRELYINGAEIKVAERKESTNACMILNYLLNIAEDFTADYSELMEDFGEIEINSLGNEERNKLFKRYYEACKNLNGKIERQTPDRINDFLSIGGSERGSIAINKKYRPTIRR